MSEIDDEFYKSVENMNVILSRTLLKTVEISERCVAKIKRLKTISTKDLKPISKLNTNDSDVYEIDESTTNDSIGEIDQSCTNNNENCFSENEDPKNFMSISNLNFFSFSSYKCANKLQSKNHYALSLTKKYEKQRQINEKKRILQSKTEPIYHTTSISPNSSTSRDTYGEQTPQTSQTMSR